MLGLEVGACGFEFKVLGAEGVSESESAKPEVGLVESWQLS